MYAECTNGREPATLPFSGHAAAHINLASRGLPYDGPRALATTPDESSSDSDELDRCADEMADVYSLTKLLAASKIMKVLWCSLASASAFSPPPRWGGMVLATSRKTRDKELPLEA